MYRNFLRGVMPIVNPNHPLPKKKRDFGLTWQDECSREAHQQMYRHFEGMDPPEDWYKNDPPSKKRPPKKKWDVTANATSSRPRPMR